jgi:CheY-like chemotaxis protein
MLCVLLEDEGYNVVTAADGLEAIDRFEESRPDLVVSDVMMPVLDGGHLASIINAREGVPVVGMTALSHLKRETDSHFAAVLHKPFQLDHFLQTISRLLPDRDPTAQATHSYY